MRYESRELCQRRLGIGQWTPRGPLLGLEKLTLDA
jgi:hypothetical protein